MNAQPAAAQMSITSVVLRSEGSDSECSQLFKYSWNNNVYHTHIDVLLFSYLNFPLSLQQPERQPINRIHIQEPTICLRRGKVCLPLASST